MRLIGWIALLALPVCLAAACGSGSAGDPLPTPGPTHALTTNFFTGELILLDVAAGGASLSLQLGDLPMDVAVAPIGRNTALAYAPTLDRKLVVVGIDRSGSIPAMVVSSEVDLSGAPIPSIFSLGGVEISRLPSVFSPTRVEIDPTGEKAFVPGLIATTVVDLGTGQALDQLVDLVPGGTTSADIRGLGATAACVTDTGDVFITNLVTSNVSRLRSGQFETPIPVGSFPVGIDCDDQYIYVACLFDDALHVLSQSSGQPVTTIPVGAGPMGVAVDRERGLCYVANFLSGDVSVIDTQLLRPTAYSPLAATNMGTLLSELGVNSSTLQSMFNQQHAGLLVGNDPLVVLQDLFELRPGGLQQLITDLLDDFLTAQGLGGTSGPIPFAGLRDCAGDGSRVYAVSAFAGTLSIIEDPPNGTPGAITSIGSALGNFGPNAISL